MSENVFRQCCVQALGISEREIHDDLKYSSIPQWDSVGHMALMAEFEQAFNIVLDAEDIVAIGNLADARAILGKYGIRFSFGDEAPSNALS